MTAAPAVKSEQRRPYDAAGSMRHNVANADEAEAKFRCDTDRNNDRVCLERSANTITISMRTAASSSNRATGRWFLTTRRFRMTTAPLTGNFPQRCASINAGRSLFPTFHTLTSLHKVLQRAMSSAFIRRSNHA
jgi:hypothetical protein